MCQLYKNDPNYIFKCSACGLEKPNNEFPVRKGGRRVREYSSKCKVCTEIVRKKWLDSTRGKARRSLISKRYIDNNPEKRRRSHISYKATHPFEYLFNTCRGNARKRGFEVHIDVDFIKSAWNEQEGKCYYTGDKMTQQLGNENSMSIDRVNSHKDYTKDNVVLCCYRVNVCKNNLNREEFISMSQKVINKFSS